MPATPFADFFVDLADDYVFGFQVTTVGGVTALSEH